MAHIKLSREKERKALLNLLDDPDPAVYSIVSDRIMQEGPDMLPYLEERYEDCRTLDEYNLISKLISHIRVDSIANSLDIWKQAPLHDLMVASWLVSSVIYTDLAFKTIDNWINDIMKDLWLKSDINQTAIEKTLLLNHIFFGKYRMRGTVKGKNNPEDFLINKVIENKTGDELIIGMIYQSLAQRLNIPLKPLLLKGGTYLLAYMAEDPNGMYNSDVLFYIYPMRRGIVFEQTEVQNFINAQKITPKPLLIEPNNPEELITTLISSLKNVYGLCKMPERESEYDRLLTKFSSSGFY